MININLLPKNLRRIREPGYWRVLAVLFPVLVFGIAFVMQFLAFQTVTNLEREKQLREDQLALLQPFIRQQRELLARQQQLNELIAIANAVRENRIIWSSEIVSMLETLPPRGASSRPNIDFQSLNMQATTPDKTDPNRYEGEPVIAEMNVTGNVVDTEVLADFIIALERNDQFGVLFQSANRQDDSSLYRYSLTIGALAGETP